MNSERNIVDKLRESSFDLHGSTYRCLYGRYYRDGDIITREEYLDAREEYDAEEEWEKQQASTRELEDYYRSGGR